MARRALTRRLRTLVVNPSGVLGGAESWLLSALDSTDRLDVEVILLADGPLREALAARGIPVTVRPTLPSLHRLPFLPPWIPGTCSLGQGRQTTFFKP